LKINLNYTRERNTFYILFFLTILATFFTYPFLKYPFDIFFHLEKIDQFYTTQVLPSHGRTHLWHYLWAKFFHFFSIDNREIFLRANIIHTTQVIISFLSLFFFSKVVLRNLFLQIESLYVNYLAYWSTLIWFLMFSTASEGQHLIWIMWYSVNYQITLPLMFAVTGLTLALVFESLSIKKTLWYLLLICLGLLFILKIHAVEFLYYALYLGVIPVIFIDKIAKFCRKHPSYAVFSVVGLVSLLTVLVPIVKKIPYKKMNGRNIFLPPNFKRREKPKPAPAAKPVNIYELNGIIPDKHNPTAILMNTKTKNTIIAGKGQTLDDGKTRLIEIKNNLVVIEKENEKEELRIKR